MANNLVNINSIMSNLTGYTSTPSNHILGKILTRSCYDFRGHKINNGEQYFPGVNPCKSCHCENGLSLLCQTILCPTHSCYNIRTTADHCCSFSCFGSDEIIKGKNQGSFNLGIRMGASALTSILFLLLVIFTIRRIRQRSLFYRNATNNIERSFPSSSSYLSSFRLPSINSRRRPLNSDPYTHHQDRNPFSWQFNPLGLYQHLFSPNSVSQIRRNSSRGQQEYNSSLTREIMGETVNFAVGMSGGPMSRVGGIDNFIIPPSYFADPPPKYTYRDVTNNTLSSSILNNENVSNLNYNNNNILIHDNNLINNNNNLINHINNLNDTSNINSPALNNGLVNINNINTNNLYIRQQNSINYSDPLMFNNHFTAYQQPSSMDSNFIGTEFDNREPVNQACSGLVHNCSEETNTNNMHTEQRHPMENDNLISSSRNGVIYSIDSRREILDGNVALRGISNGIVNENQIIDELNRNGFGNSMVNNTLLRENLSRPGLSTTSTMNVNEVNIRSQEDLISGINLVDFNRQLAVTDCLDLPPSYEKMMLIGERGRLKRETSHDDDN